MQMSVVSQNVASPSMFLLLDRGEHLPVFKNFLTELHADPIFWT